MLKKYGLIIPGSKPSLPPKADFSKPSIFGDDSDSDEASQAKISFIGPGANQKRMARKIQQKALEEDPTIFQYDELYNDMESKREEEKKAKSSEVKKPKYIERLLEFASQRTIENERRLERMIQKERESEGEQFKDKESFVTSSYRKKLEEFKEAEKREKREDYLEAIGDVTKQGNLDGFYRHLYEQKLGSKEKVATEEEKETSQSPEPQTSSKFKQTKPRTYRKRCLSDDDNEQSPCKQDNSASKKLHLQSNLDADSDFSIDSSSDSDSEDKRVTEKTEDPIGDVSSISIKQEPIDKEQSSTKNTHLTDVSNTIIEPHLDNIKEEPKTELQAKKDEKSKKPKVDIWKKRTIGAVLEESLKRYYERKAARIM